MKNCLLFDFDGTLADSQILYDIAASKSLSKINPKYNLDYCIEFFNGRGWKDIFLEIEKLEPLHNIQKVFNEALEEAKILTFNKITPTKNARKMLVKAKMEGYKMAICSNASLDAVTHHLDLCHIDDIFNEEDIFTLESVLHAKPSPEIYLKAMKHFNVKPSNCLIVEDSVAGLTAACNAGIDGLFYTGATHNFNKNQKIQNILEMLNNMNNNTIIGNISDLMEIFNYTVNE